MSRREAQEAPIDPFDPVLLRELSTPAKRRLSSRRGGRKKKFLQEEVVRIAKGTLPQGASGQAIKAQAEEVRREVEAFNRRARKRRREKVVDSPTTF